MTRDIDFSKPLDADEQAYVADRPWLVQDAKLRGEDVIFEEDFTVGDDDDDSDDESGDDTGSEDEDGSEENEEDSDDSEEESEGEVAPYEEWSYQDLKDEAKSRDLSASGSKEQLVARLLENDGSAPE